MPKKTRKVSPEIRSCLSAWKELNRALNNDDEDNDSVRDAAVNLRDAFWDYVEILLERGDK